MLLKMPSWLLKALINLLLNITSNVTDNTDFFSSVIAYKCPILADLWDHIDNKKTFP
jgi:hypothetical protein